MTEPIHPKVLGYRLLRRKAAIKLAVWVVIILAVIATWVAALIFTYVANGSSGAFIFLGVSFFFGLFFAPLFFFTFEPNNPLEEYLDAAHSLRFIENSVAWDAQQEELKKLRNIIKEEGL